jgi:hypothetical protein
MISKSKAMAASAKNMLRNHACMMFCRDILSLVKKYNYTCNFLISLSPVPHSCWRYCRRRTSRCRYSSPNQVQSQHLQTIRCNGWDQAVWLERLAVNAKDEALLVSIPASSDTVEFEGRQMKQCWITYIKWKNPKKSHHYHNICNWGA